MMVNVHCTIKTHRKGEILKWILKLIWLTSLQRPVQSQSCQWTTSPICLNLTALKSEMPSGQTHVPSQQ